MQKIRLKVINIIIFSLVIFNFYSQIKYYEDNFKGGVCFAGFSTCFGYGTGQFQSYVEPGSNIKKVFLLYHALDDSIDTSFILDNTKIIIGKKDRISIYREEWASSRYYKTHVLDITSIYQNITNHTITNFSYNTNPFLNYGNFGLIILYENSSLENVNFILFANNQDMTTQSTFYSVKGNKYNHYGDFGFSIKADIIYSPSLLNEGSYVYFENDSLGLIGGADQVNSSFDCGCRGHFYYQNGQLIGLDDDTPDQIMNNTDALANVSNSIINDSIFKWSLFWQIPNLHANEYENFFLTYTTNCIPFEVQTSRDTAICAGQSLTLNASGGQKYLWRPNQFLSCDTCPNPVFSGDSSQLYTVQIWNNDTCSVTRPVKVNVIPLPKVPNFMMLPSVCGAQTGKVTFQNNPNLSYQLLPNTAQTNAQFTNLGGGAHVFQVIDTNGCVSEDTLITISTNQNTLAQFSANPNAGSPPLLVNFSNQSQNANQYNWFINGQYIGNTLNSQLFDTSGVYQIQLIALKNNDSTCADTTWLTLYIYEELQVTLPNVFTPNNDGINDFFNITVNGPIKVKGQILNRWGNVLCEVNETLSAGSSNLWDGKTKGAYVNDGTYFYNLVLDKAENSPPYKNEFPIKQSGFVVIER